MKAVNIFLFLAFTLLFIGCACKYNNSLTIRNQVDCGANALAKDLYDMIDKKWNSDFKTDSIRMTNEANALIKKYAKGFSKKILCGNIEPTFAEIKYAKDYFLAFYHLLTKEAMNNGKILTKEGVIAVKKNGNIFVEAGKEIGEYYDKFIDYIWKKMQW